ncbi:hypothetical protein CBER1_01319 [Cercospora berteroae]|uniref:HMG box domain-containing protein n=1 Tax=Cercospora berteroae TaxID=357750 RepID=A0A2S6CKP4_9PEZI|nr:hypothetical protein CBER1_01319 [Cercospora berteroae]
MLTRVALRFSARSRLPNVLPRCNRAVPSPLVLPIRTYATPGRPKSVVGEPSRPVKRAVKKAASKPRDGTSAAEKKVAAKKRKPAAKRAVSPEEAAQKAIREAARKEKATERKAATKKRTKLQDLKATALPDAPKKTAYPSAYLAFWAEAVKERKTNQGVKERIKEAATEWKQQSAADIEHYNHLARTANEAAAAEYKRWIASHSPNEIRLANLARAQLRRQYPTQKGKWAELSDERRPKRPTTAYLNFGIDRQSSGDFANIKVTERSKLISQEWKALSQNEKDKYQRLFEQDRQRYEEEQVQVYGQATPRRKKPAVAAAAA